MAQTAKAARFLKNSFSSLAGLSIAGFGIQSLVKSSDELQLLTDKMSVFAREGQTGLDVMNNITQVANRQGQSIADLATIYNRLEISTQELKLSSEETLAMTEVLAQSFRLAGATGSEMRGVTIQLSQAMAAGALQGQELRSVMEGNALVALALKKELGLAGDTIDQVRQSIFKFAEGRGGITAAEVFSALANNADKFDEMAQKLNFTIGQSMNIALNKIGSAWNNFNSQMGVTSSIGKAIVAVANNMDIAMAALAATATYFLVPALASAVLTMKAYVAGATLATIATKGLAASMGFIGGVLKAVISIKGAVVIAVGALVYALLNWEKTQAVLNKVILQTQLYFNQFRQSVGEVIISAGKFANSATIIAAGTTLIGNSAKNITRLKDEIDKLDKKSDEVKEKNSNSSVLGGAASRIKGDGKVMKDTLLSLNTALNSNAIKMREYTDRLKKLRLEEVQREFLAGKIDAETRAKREKEIMFGKVRDLNRLNQATAELNRQFLKDKDVEKYYATLNSAVLKDTKEKFSQGRIQLEQFMQQMDNAKIAQFNDEFRKGAMNVIQYNQAIDNIRMESLKRQLEGNIISLEEYHRQIIAITEEYQPGSAFFVGTMDYIKQAGTISNGVAKATQNAFGALENGLMDFIKTGTFEFKKFAQSILDDINRIIVRSMVVRPLAQAILGSYDMGTTSVDKKALGGAYNSNGVEFFAKGGIVNAPTMFKHSRGLGMAGEAGPEAIIPLKRGRGGELGVSATSANVTVNVINQSEDTETRQTERSGENGERIIDVLILNKVKEGFASGAFDKQMNSQYGLRRRGG